MRTTVVFSLVLACAAIAPGAFACDGPGRRVDVEVIINPPSAAATLQSQTFLADATKLDGKADTEESASATVVASARLERRKAAAIRAQAAQASEASQAALLARADKLDAEAAAHDVASASFLARAKIIRARSRALRLLSTHVLTSGAVTMQVLPRIVLPAAPSGHPDRSPLKLLDAAPKVAAAPMHVAGI